VGGRKTFKGTLMAAKAVKSVLLPKGNTLAENGALAISLERVWL